MWSDHDITFDPLDDLFEDAVATLSIKTPIGSMMAMGLPTVCGTALMVDAVHVQGVGIAANSIGAENLRIIAGVLMERLGYDELVVQGAMRTSGANPGRRPVSSGSPAVVALRAGLDRRRVLTIPAMIALMKRHASLAAAETAVEQAMETGRSVLTLPMLEDPGALAADIAAAGMRVAVMAPEEDVKAVRETLGLTRDQFAIHYGLDADAVAAWEDGRDAPDRAVRSCLKVIRHLPLQASEALEHSV